MALASWPAYSDDSGTKTDGTTINVALLDAIKQAIIDDIVSATNPTEVLADIIDEIVDARGSLGALDTRLDVALNEDGTLKAIAGQATETQLSNALGARNLVRNSELQQWHLGASLAPSEFTLAGAGAAVARTGTGTSEADSTHLGAGRFTVKVTSGPGAAATLTQAVESATMYGYHALYEGRKVQFSAVVQCSVGSTARLVVADGASSSNSSYHTGGGTPEVLTVEHEVSSSGTKIDVYLEVAAGTNVAYMAMPQLFFSDLAVTEYVPEPSIWQRGGLVSSVAGIPYAATSGTGEETLFQLPGGIPAGALARVGSFVRLRMGLGQTANTNNKTLKVYLGANAFTFPVSATATHVAVAVDITLQYLGGTTFGVLGLRTLGPTNGTVILTEQAGVSTITVADVGSANQFAVSGQVATTGSMGLYQLTLEVLP